MQNPTDFKQTFRTWRYLRSTGHNEAAHQLMRSFWQPVSPMITYMILYLLSFFFIEQMTRLQYTNIHVALDDMIPFCELFVIPYLTWFSYMILSVLLLFMYDRENYHKSATMLYIGMTLFIVLSLAWPNIQYIRPEVMPRNNVLTRIIEGLYRTDTPTNLCPSIHVFNTLVAMTGVHRCTSTRLARNTGYRFSMYTIGVLIILSTMFIKQHSVFDVCCAFALFAVSYVAVYWRGFSLSGETNSLTHAARRQKQLLRRIGG